MNTQSDDQDKLNPPGSESSVDDSTLHVAIPPARPAYTGEDHTTVELPAVDPNQKPDDDADVSPTAPTLVGDERYIPPDETADDIAPDDAADDSPVDTIAADIETSPLDTDADIDERLSRWARRDPEQNLETVISSETPTSLLDAAALSDLVAAEEAALDAERDAERRAKPIPVYKTRFPMPPMSNLQRGHPGSVVPAILLMLIGAWLTLAGTGSLSGILPADTLPPEIASAILAPTPLIVAGVALVAVVISLLAHWIGAGRWARGTIFTALGIIGIAVVIGLALQPGGIDLTRGYPLLMFALAGALILVGLLARPVERRVFIPAIALIVAGGVGLAFTGGYAPPTILRTAAPFAPIVAALVLLIWIAPSIVRRRK